MVNHPDNLRGVSLWPTTVERYLSDRSDRIRTAASRENLRCELSRLQRMHPGKRLNEFTEADLVAFCKFDPTGEIEVSPGTQRIRRGILEQFYVWALRTGLISTDPTAHIRDKINPPRVRVMQRQWLEAAEFQAVIDLCGTDDWPLRGYRDQVLILLAATTGLRRSELAGLRWRHIDLDVRHIQVEKGKGQKDRVAGISDELAAVLKGWRETVEEGLGRPIRGDDAVTPRVRWFTFHAPGRQRVVYWNSPLRDGAIYPIVRERVMAAAPRCERFSPHDLRRSFASWVKERYTIRTAEGVELTDWVKVQKALGHEQVATTIMYCKDDGREQARVGQEMQFGFSLNRPAG